MFGKVLGLVCLLLSPVSAIANDWDAALVAYDDERYEDAIALMTPLAEDGLVQAQATLAHIYGFGHGTSPDAATAFDWMHRAAEKGDAGARSKLGQMYLVGAGVEKDEAQAVYWMELAANQYEPAALYNLATMTLNGIGTKMDPASAIDLYYAAVTLREPNSMFALGVIYLQGQHEPADIDLGLQFLSWSAQLGNRRASAMLGLLLQEIPEVDYHLVKSAAHFEVAIAEGCDDLGEEAAKAVARLSAEDLALYERSLPDAFPSLERDPHDHVASSEHCLPLQDSGDSQFTSAALASGQTGY